MAPRLDLQAAFDGARAKIDEAGRDVSAAMARYDPQRLGRAVGTQAARALVEAARRAPPALRGQLLVAAAQVAPKAPPRRREPPSAKKPAKPTPAKGSGIAEGFNRVGAFVNGAGDAALLGAGNHIAAFQNLKYGAGVGANPIEKYKWLVERERRRDQTEEAKYPISRGAGTVAGTIAPILLTGGASAAPQGFARIAPHAVKGAGFGAKALARRFGPQAAIGAAGGVSSGAVQVATDAVDPRRRVNLKDAAAATVGGVAGALGALYGSPRVGATSEAVTTEFARAALTGEAPSLEAIGRNAVTGSYLGKFGGDAAARWSNGLPASKYYKRGRRLSKEEMGEQLSEWKSRLRGEGVGPNRQKKFELSSGGHTKADHVTSAGAPVESKFGYSAKLTKRQQEAAAELENYRIDHFTPDDIAKGFGGFLALIGGQTADPARPVSVATTAPHATPHARP